MELGFSFWVAIILIAIVMGALQGTCAYLILAERKISAWVQDRLGPNRVGPWGLLQPIADGLKFLFKEEIVPGHVDRLFYLLAPGISIATALLAFAVVPFGPTSVPPTLVDHRAEVPEAVWRVAGDAGPIDTTKPTWQQTNTERQEVIAADEWYADKTGEKSFEKRLKEYNNTLQFVIAPHVDIGLVFIFAIGSLTVYGIILGGWSSNSKYSMLGSLRSSAQIISYEIPLGLSALGVILVSGSLNLERIIDYQHYHGWNILFQPLAALLFATSVFAECNRLPFDLPEAEQELVGGYHTEYSAMKFAMFFLGEYTHMITTSFLVVILFFGGWLFPWIAVPGDNSIGALIIKVIVIAVKMTLFIIFYMLVRWTLPRFRFDQLMGLTWKVLMPLALINLVAVLCIKQFEPFGPYYSAWLLLPISLALLVAFTWVALLLPRPRLRNPLYAPGHAAGNPALAQHREGLRSGR